MFYILKFEKSNEVRHYRQLMDDLTADCVANEINQEDYDLIEAEKEPVIGYDGKLYLFGHEPAKPLDEYKYDKVKEIDVACSKAILSGFWYEYNAQKLHFSYDVFDQQNFADTANNCLALIIGGYTNVTVNWNAYTDIEHKNLVVLTLNPSQFLDIYQKGASFGHKAILMEKAGELKEAIKAAQSVEELEGITW